MSLSFSTTSRLGTRPACGMPPLFSASKAMPAVIAPSPMMATQWRLSPLSCAPSAMPSAAEIEVEECAVPKASYSLSSRLGKPDRPPAWRSVGKRSLRPVRILCG